MDEAETLKEDDKMLLIILFPGHLKENGYDKKEMLKELRTLQVNSTKSDTSLRRLLMEKSRIEEEIKEKMNVHYIAILKDDLSLKEKDPRSFILPCSINNMCFDNALADLRASVCVMPYLNFTKLGLELRNHEMEDLDPEIEEGEIIDEPMVDVVKIRHDVVENMDAYSDKYIGDIIFGKPFCWVACVEARRFDGFITIYDDNDNVTYQMDRSHPRNKSPAGMKTCQQKQNTLAARMTIPNNPPLN
nr:hypothetical protein [Tanacetum cinerariifolium]